MVIQLVLGIMSVPLMALSRSSSCSRNSGAMAKRSPGLWAPPRLPAAYF